MTGHADILRELVDGPAGRDHDELGDAAWWQAYVQRVEDAAQSYRVD